MRAGSSAGGATMSAQPAAMALLGIESNCAVSGSCTRQAAHRLDRLQPSVPSDPMPERITAMARSPCALARDENSTLIGSACRAARRCRQLAACR
jgi:hypothetical protein